MKRRAVGGSEQDAFSRFWRQCVFWQRGELAKVKRGAHKRERREGKQEARAQREDG